MDPKIQTWDTMETSTTVRVAVEGCVSPPCDWVPNLHLLRQRALDKVRLLEVC